MDANRWNPCKVGRHPALVSLGDNLAAFFIDRFEEPTEGCPCCMAVRILLFAGIAGAIGFALGALL